MLCGKEGPPGELPLTLDLDLDRTAHLWEGTEQQLSAEHCPASPGPSLPATCTGRSSHKNLQSHGLLGGAAPAPLYRKQAVEEEEKQKDSEDTWAPGLHWQIFGESVTPCLGCS